MSGKAPPTGPRALLGSAPSIPSSGPSSSPVASSPTSSPTTNRYATSPPKRPRGFTDGFHTSPKTPSVDRGKPLQAVNGHTNNQLEHSSNSVLHAPFDSSPSLKGKQPEASSSSSPDDSNTISPSHPTLVNGQSDTRWTTSDASEVNHPRLDRQAIRISFLIRPNPLIPHSPNSEPPPPPSHSPKPSLPPPLPTWPPPPPLSEPPPPPPPLDEPPPPPPATTPPPPPLNEFPPPPPPSEPPPTLPSEPPPPQVPLSLRATPESSLLPSRPIPPPLPLVSHPLRPSSPPFSQEPPSASVPSQPSPSPPRPLSAQAKPATPPPPKFYSLPPPPPLPPRSQYASCRDYKVIFDPAVDKDRDGHVRSLIEKLRASGAVGGEEPRVKEGKSKGKEILFRFSGEVAKEHGETDVEVWDPRKVPGFKKPSKPPRSEFHGVHYVHDNNSTGPPPPTAVLITNISPLTPNHQLRRYFGKYGAVTSFEPQIDKENGGALGIVFIKFSTHEEAKKCAERENGKKLTAGNGLVLSLPAGLMESEGVRVVLDGEGRKLRAVLKELDDRKKREREEKRKREKEKAKEPNGTSSSIPTPTPSDARTPAQSTPSWRSSQRPSHLPQNPLRAAPGLPPRPASPVSSVQGHLNDADVQRMGAKPEPARIRKPPDAFLRARTMTSHPLPPRPPSIPASQSSSSTPIHTHSRGYRLSYADRHYVPGSPSRSTHSHSRSPSPISRRFPHQQSQIAKQEERENVLAELAQNGMDHVKIDGGGANLGGAVREEDVRKFFDGFKVDKILQDHLGWYVTFQTSDSARRAAMVLNSGTRTLAHRSVTVTRHPPPSHLSVLSQSKWEDGELIEQAMQTIVKDLRGLLEKDIVDRIVGTTLRKVALEEKARRAVKSTDDSAGVEQKVIGRRGLKGLSFKKQPKREREVIEEEPKPNDEEKLDEDVGEPEVEVEDKIDAEQRTSKKRKKVKKTKVLEVDIESELDEPPSANIVEQDEHKRSAPEEIDDFAPPRKKAKKVEPKKKTTAKKTKAKTVAIVADSEPLLPDVVDIRITPDSSRLPSPSPPYTQPEPVRIPSPPLDPFQQGLCDDDEDLYFAKLALSHDTDADTKQSHPPLPDSELLPFRKHITGSARTEGYYKISHAEKSVYVAQYASRSTFSETAAPVEATPTHPVVSSRSNRANARRRAQGLEEINQVQRAVALSMGETAAAELTIKFNQLQTRKKHLRFARSPIHDWGLYAMERISRGELVIEYVGEVIRAQVADKREKAYERQGIGSSYLFRIDEDLVVDATKKGNLGRLINHSCDPNCTARIITINGEKKIVIYAKQDIELGDEITYDYHFPIEQDKIPCLCGSVKCRGYLN